MKILLSSKISQCIVLYLAELFNYNGYIFLGIFDQTQIVAGVFLILL